MSLNVVKCIQGKIDSGAIKKEIGKETIEQINNLDLLKTSDTVKKEALDKLADRLKHDNNIKSYQFIKKLQTQVRLDRQIHAHPKNAAEGLLSTLTHDLAGRADGLNVDKLREGIRGLAYADMPDMVLELSAKNLGLTRNRKLEQNVVRALFGDTKDEAANKIAGQWRKGVEALRQRFIKAGGDMPELNDWIMPQNHDSRLLNNVTAEEWTDYIMPLLDREKTTDSISGFPFEDDELRAVLADVYETLRTNGLNKMEPGQPKTRNLANKYKEHRFLFFKDADAWIKYNETFGNADIFKTLTEHIDNMANDIAFLEVWGPNPDLMKSYMSDMVRKEAALLRDEKAQNKIVSKLHSFDVLWDDISGNSAVPVNPTTAKVNSEIRSLMISSQLGGAFLSQLSDFVTNGLTAKFNGLAATDLYKNVFKLMTGNKARNFAVHIGLGADEMTRILGATQRQTGPLLTNGKMAKVASVIMRASLLERMTMASKKAFELDFASTLGRMSGQAFDSLPQGLRNAFERYGITSQEWALIKKSPLSAFDGAKYLNIAETAKLGGKYSELVNKLQNMILTERDFAVIDTNPRTRAFLVGNSRPGTWFGEARRYFGMYKTFPLTILMHHISRMATFSDLGSKLGYATAMFVPMTILGALSMQAKNIAAGKEPIPMDGWKPWLAAATQGGGAGIIGDFLFSDQSRAGGGLVSTLIGPGGGLVNDVWELGPENIKQWLAGEDPNFTPEAIAFVRRYTPGNNLWQTKLVVERTLFDQVSLALDPKAQRYFNRKINRQYKDYGSGYWWNPGETSPDF